LAVQPALWHARQRFGAPWAGPQAGCWRCDTTRWSACFRAESTGFDLRKLPEVIDLLVAVRLLTPRAAPPKHQQTRLISRAFAADRNSATKRNTAASTAATSRL
jgi:hypothetical protein